MFKKLDKMLERFDKLNQLVSVAEVISRIVDWKAYTKELAEITETVEKYTEYKKVIKEEQDIKEMLPLESDPEMKALMEEELFFMNKNQQKMARISLPFKVLILQDIITK